MTDKIELPNELDFEQWYCENAFNFEANSIGSRDCSLQRKAWHAAIRAMLDYISIYGMPSQCAHGFHYPNMDSVYDTRIEAIVAAMKETNDQEK